jgi:putative ATP-dependent endonuclease of OLD family
MRIDSIEVKGFRCFGARGQRVALSALTCLVGPNASGKTAAMIALLRMFGESQRERTVAPSDFHLVPGEKLSAVDERQLSIEVTLAFPELDEADVDNEAKAIPESFNQMIVDAPEATPYCRIRLEATWLNDGTPSGEVQQGLWWILTASVDPEVEANHRRRVSPAERSRVRVVYVPATRDPTEQIRGTTTTAYGRLLKALDWEGKDDKLRETLKDLNAELGGLAGIGMMNERVQDAWNRFYDGRIAANVAFEPVEADPSALLRMLAPSFAPDEQGRQVPVGDLSDGLRSLFSISLPLGLFHVEERLKTAVQGSGFLASVADQLPLLTVFALEEPENHLSPHYLGRVVQQLSKAAHEPGAQVMLSSHSPSIMARIEPDAVRYFFGGEASVVSEVRTLDLPADDSDEAFKYVREAVRGYPELYFSRLVVLGEGPSEEIVLRRVFEESGTPLDAHFISVVPLGGRHVSHFWRLLKGLGVPFITLLDLDREKAGGGWGRIQYVRDQLVALHGQDAVAPESGAESEGNRSLMESDYDSLKERCSRTAIDELDAWVSFLQEEHDVFFSAPLDLDFSMLGAFPGAYEVQAPSGCGPRLPKEEPARSEAARKRMRQVLVSDPIHASPELGSSYSEEERQRFPWYKYLFQDGSKPVAHMRALVTLDGTDWIADLPESLSLLVARARHLVGARGTGSGA